jgi:hypothetical protein
MANRNPNNFFRNLQNFYGIKVINDPVNKDAQIAAPVDPLNGNRLMKFPDHIQKIWNFWGKECYDTGLTLQDRFNRYDDLDYMYFNMTIISRAANMYGDEATQDDSQFNVIHCESKDKTFPEYFYDLLNKWGLGHEQLNNLCRNIALYGDAYTINVVDETEGVQEVKPVDVRTIKERIEFTPDKAETQMSTNRGLTQFTPVSNFVHLQRLASVIQNKDEISKYYRTYLFGYHLGTNQYLAPWNVSHFRLYDSKTEFYPYGRSLFINCIAPFRQLKAATTIYEIGKAVNIPIKHFEVETTKEMTTIDKWRSVNNAREEYENLNLTQSNKEDYGVGSSIWTPKDTLSMKMESPNINLSDIADLEFYVRNIATGVDIPSSILMTDDKGWGTSGTSLMQQYKPFARAVKKVQSPVLHEITQLVKIHLIITGDYPEDLDFTLSMNFPALEETVERTNQRNNSLNLAGNIITALKNHLGALPGEELPMDVVKDILSQYSFLKSEDLDTWLKKFSKEHAAKEKELQQKNQNNFNNNQNNNNNSDEQLDMEDMVSTNNSNKNLKQKKEERQRKFRSRLTEEVLHEIYYKSFRKLNLKEGVINNRSFVNSSYKDPQKQFILETIKESKTSQRIQEYQDSTKWKLKS